MITCKLHKPQNGATAGKVLTFSGGLTLPNASKIRAALLAAIECGEDVTVECARVTAVDLSGLQLLCSAYRTADERGRKLTLKPPFPTVLLDVITELGFTREGRCLPPFEAASDAGQVAQSDVAPEETR